MLNGNYKYSIEGTNKMYAEAKQENCLYGIAKATGLMAQIYSRENRYEDAEKYFKETIKNALKLIKEEPDQISNYHLVSTGYHRLAATLSDQEKKNEYFSLMPVWKKHTMAYEKTFGCPDPSLVYYYRFCAHMYIDKEKYDEAELYCDSMKPIILFFEMPYIWGIKTTICEKRNEYDSAINWIDKNIDHCTNLGELSFTVYLLKDKARILSKMGQAGESYSVFKKAFQLNDSLRLLANNAQLDEIRTQYEVDKHVAEKERNFNYFLLALSSAVFFAIALGIWMFYSRKTAKKNRILAQQIKELTLLQEEQINESLTDSHDLCIETRMDKLCIDIRDLLFKDKYYRDSGISRDSMIEKLGTNKRAFSEAFERCFKMQFKDYVIFLRLKDAVLLLEQSDLSIEEISFKVGFGTARSFRNQFNEKYNMTPKDYRNSRVTTVPVS